MGFDLDKVLFDLTEMKLPKESVISDLCDSVIAILNKEMNVLAVNSPVTICGDIHGQFEDLLELFRIGGDCPEVNYLFLGDYVDRGYRSVETFLYLIGLKVKYPERIILIRGNHETRSVTQVYGFYDECNRKFGSLNVWHKCINVFDNMPIAAIIDSKILCVHGGISPNIPTIQDIEVFNRFIEVPNTGLMCDLMWSDPDDIDNYQVSPRGAGYLYGKKAVEKFLFKNNLTSIVRAHQLVMEGYKNHFDQKVITIWSAPNYCYRCGNIAAILEYDENLNKTFKVFEQSPEIDQANKSNYDEFPLSHYIA